MANGPAINGLPSSLGNIMYLFAWETVWRSHFFMAGWDPAFLERGKFRLHFCRTISENSVSDAFLWCSSS